MSVILAGATGELGGRIAKALIERGASVKAIVRQGSAAAKVEGLRKQGVEIVEADFASVPDLATSCSGGACVVSALSGLREVIVEAQTMLLKGAVEAGVPRFIPSDFAIDFTKLRPGTNRNLDLRREFSVRLDRAPIAATSILNGMFADLLIGPAPLILPFVRRVIYWGDADQLLDFTTMDDTAAFTAAAALDPSTPRFLRIAGDQKSARGLAEAASDAMGKDFRLFRAGGVGALNLMSKVLRVISPARSAVFPPWQGMQYLRDMFSGRAKLDPLDNKRYLGMHWKPVWAVLSEEKARGTAP